MKFNITDFGAKTDGSLCTKAIQQAIDAAFLSGGGEVIIPAGVFLTGGIRLRTNTELHLLENAILKGSIYPEDYCTYLDDKLEPISEEERNAKVSSAFPECKGRSIYPYSRWNNAIIRAINAENISIIGEPGSIIDGQNCFDEQGEEHYRGPHGINMWHCKNVVFSGYTIENTGNWAHAIQNSENIKVNKITVLGGHDGFDIRTCDNIFISECKFYSGDDAIAGFDNIYVRVKNCILNSSCSAMRFGGNDVIVENCTAEAPNRYGFRGSLSIDEKKNRLSTNEKNSRFNCVNVFLYYCDYRAKIRRPAGNIIIRNCNFKNIDSVFSHPYNVLWCCNRPLNDITFENCIFDGVCESINIKGGEDEQLTFKMKNCKIKAREGAGNALFMGAADFKSIVLENVEVSGYNNAEIVCSSEENIALINSPGISVRKGDNFLRGVHKQ